MQHIDFQCIVTVFILTTRIGSHSMHQYLLYQPLLCIAYYCPWFCFSVVAFFSEEIHLECKSREKKLRWIAFLYSPTTFSVKTITTTPASETMVEFCFARMLAWMQHAIKWKLGLIKLDFFSSNVFFNFLFYRFIRKKIYKIIRFSIENAQRNETNGTVFMSNQFWLKAFNTWSNFVCLILKFGIFESHKHREWKLSNRRDGFFPFILFTTITHWFFS